MLKEGFVIAACKGLLGLTHHKMESACSFSYFMFFNFSIDLTISIKMLRLDESVDERILFTKCFVDKIKKILVHGCNAVEVRLDFVKTKFLLLMKLA